MELWTDFRGRRFRNDIKRELKPGEIVWNSNRTYWALIKEKLSKDKYACLWYTAATLPGGVVYQDSSYDISYDLAWIEIRKPTVIIG